MSERDPASPDEAAPYSSPLAFDPPPETSWGKVLALVPQGSKVLDVGCAFGAFSSAMRRRRGCRVTGVEINPESARVAAQHCDEVVVGDIAAVSANLPSDFDVVVAADVLEHLLQPADALRTLAKHLKPGGILLASIPNVTHLSIAVSLLEGTFPRSREGLLDSTHVQFFGEADVLALFHEAGYAARVADRVRIDPQLTEFKSDLGAMPEAVLAFLNRNPNADTYQFIVRAVPRAWAGAGDDQTSALPLGPPLATQSIRAELDGAHSRLTEYHQALTNVSAELKKSNEELRRYHEALTAERSRLVTLEQEHKRGTVELARARDEIELRDVRRRAAEHDRPDAAKLRVLFVTDRDDAPFRYRCVHGCQQLRASGAVANIAHITAPGLIESLPSYSVVILFRLPWSPAAAAVVDTARKAGASVGFDIDDLIFDPDVERWMPFVERASPEERAKYRQTMGALAETLRNVDFCLAATPAIARHARSRGVRALVHPNLLSDEYLRMSRLLSPLRARLLRAPLISYLSGSNTHDGDLEAIAPALVDLFAQRPDARLAICGHARVPVLLRSLQHRIVRLPYQDYRVYPALLVQSSAVVAPLEEVNEFTEAKSALKIFEAGVFGTPAVASPAGQYRDAIRQGESGFVAATQDEWQSALLRLCDRETSLAFGAKARRVALAEHSTTAYQHALARVLLEVAGKAARAEQPALSPLEAPTRVGDALRLARRSLMLALDPARRSDESDTAVEMLPSTGPAASAASEWVSVARREGRALLAGATRIGTLLADREQPIAGWRLANVQPLESASPGCRFESFGTDPSFTLEPAPALAVAPRALVVQLRARFTDAAAMAQLFWKKPGAGFSEGRSLTFPVVADGEPRAYLLELHGLVPVGIDSIRFDPIDRAGEFEITQLALIEEVLPAGLPDARRELAARFLAGPGLEIGALQNPLPMPPEAQVRYVDRLPLSELRRQYPELEGQNLVDPSILASGDDLGPVASGSVRFVATNHVLEHMRDPLGALAEWLRVLEPGGKLYASIPGRENPHDRNRPLTTFEHLLEDHQQRGRKGSAVDRAAYHEWVEGVHGATMPAAERRTFAERLIEQDYSIHFHVFDRALFERLIERVCARSGARLIELVEAPFDQYREYIAVLEKKAPVAMRGVDVVVPIYNARGLTRRCVESALLHSTADARIVLADDASPDPGIAEDLRAFAARDPRVVVLTNEKNLGFVGTANRAMRHAEGRDVLLLNSDTEVFAGFLERLREAAYADPHTGIVTPFSNNATIYSLPQFGDNEIPEGHTGQSMDLLVRTTSRRLRPEMPTAVGFCMYIRAEVIEKVGLFDEQTFGRGFGEEDDLCQRAKKAGFKVRLCDDVFVWHKGKASFGKEGHELEGRNGPLLRKKHPEYAVDVARFFRTNPVATLQREVRFHLPRLRDGARGAALFILHASPFIPSAGGTEHHVRELLQALALPRAVLAYPEGASQVAAEIIDGNVASPTFFRFPLREVPERFAISNPEVERLVEHFVELFGIRWAHIHHLMFWPISIGAALRAAGVPYLVTSHDYYAVCPSWNLYDYGRRERCPCPDPEQGAGCVPAFLKATNFPTPAGVSALQLRKPHREAWLDTLRGARTIVTPSDAARRILKSHLDLGAVPIEVVEHGYDAVKPTSRKQPSQVLRIAVLGEVAYPIKGSARYRELFEATRELPVEWNVFGDVEIYGYGDTLRALNLGDRLRLHGRYSRETILERLAAEGIDLCVMFPEVDETFSFTLSESLLAGIPVLVADRGALPDRVRKAGAGVVVKSVAEAVEQIRRFCADRDALVPLATRARAFEHQTIAGNAARYRDLYRSLGFALTLNAELRPELLRELSNRAGVHATSVQPSPPPSPLTRTTRVLRRVQRVAPRGGKLLQRILQPPVAILNSARQAVAVVGLRLLGKTWSTATYESESADPQLLFHLRGLPTAKVNELRFRMRRATPGVAHAQLYWAPPGEGFNEERSAIIVLDAPAGEWREYSLRLDHADVVSRWRCGTVAQLRFDPLDQPGILELGPLELRGS